MTFQGFTVEHQQNRTVLYPYGEKYKTVCVYLEPDGSYIAHTTEGNKMGKLDKTRDKYSLAELQELCSLVVKK
jgi:hypothetical protein